MKQTLLTIALLGIGIGLWGQERYADEIFSDVTVTADVMFSDNFGFFSGFQALDTLRMDIYEPMGDTMSNRPLIILMHPGSFLPKGVNTLPFGDRKDSAMVEMCKQFAKRGFVAVASSYRAGWNPASSDQDVRGGTIITATVLGALDAKNCIKFFRQDAAGDNTYRIDPDKVVLGGTNTGGYVALAANNFDEPADLALLKFKNSQTGESYFDTTLHGNFDGVGGSVNNVQYEGIDGDPNLILNMGGAAGDTSIFNDMDAPTISICGRNDPLTPDSVGVVVVSGAGGVVPVIEVHGGLTISRYLTTIGVNSSFSSISGDPYTAQAEANLMKTGKDPADYLGYYEIQDPLTGYEPWGWYDPDHPNIVQGTNPDSANFQEGATGFGSRANPFATKAKALAHIDTVMGFFIPRAMLALGLGDDNMVVVDSSVVDIIVGSAVHETLEAAVIAADLVDALSGEGPFTVFAPTDSAFAALPEGLLDTLLADPSGDLTDILLYHVLGATVPSDSLSDGQVATTLQGSDITITIDSNGVFINDAMVMVTDIMADNGIVHVIDAVLVPPADTATSIDQTLKLEAGLNIFPNPTTSSLAIQVGNATMPIRALQLIDMAGRTVQSVSGIRTTKHLLNVEDLVSGVYVLKVDLDRGSVTQRVMIRD